MRFLKEANFSIINFKKTFLKKRFVFFMNIDYIFGGLDNPFKDRNHALNDNSINNIDWVAVAIKYLIIGKTTGILSLNVINRPITIKVFSIFRDRSVKTFIAVIAKAISIVSAIAVSKYFQPSYFLIIRGASL